MSRYVDADELLKEADLYIERLQRMYKRRLRKGEVGVFLDLKAIAEECATVDVVPVRHGHWMEEVDPEEDCWNEEVVTCSCCNEQIRVHETDNTYFLPTRRTLKYCPNCGAKMDAEREE